MILSIHIYTYIHICSFYISHFTMYSVHTVQCTVYILYIQYVVYTLVYTHIILNISNM